MEFEFVYASLAMIELIIILRRMKKNTLSWWICVKIDRNFIVLIINSLSIVFVTDLIQIKGTLIRIIEYKSPEKKKIFQLFIVQAQLFGYSALASSFSRKETRRDDY